MISIEAALKAVAAREEIPPVQIEDLDDELIDYLKQLSEDDLEDEIASILLLSSDIFEGGTVQRALSPLMQPVRALQEEGGAAEARQQTEAFLVACDDVDLIGKINASD